LIAPAIAGTARACLGSRHRNASNLRRGRFMTRILAIAAVALMTAATGAAAKGHGTTTISLDNVCDVLVFKKNTILKTALEMSQSNTDCEDLHGAGFFGKVSTFGKVAVIGLRGGSIPDEEYVLEIAYPFVTGGQYILYGTEDGTSLSAFAGGTYTVGGTPAKGARPVTAPR
jgi:hypothetical protein